MWLEPLGVNVNDIRPELQPQVLKLLQHALDVADVVDTRARHAALGPVGSAKGGESLPTHDNRARNPLHNGGDAALRTGEGQVDLVRRADQAVDADGLGSAGTH